MELQTNVDGASMHPIVPLPLPVKPYYQDEQCTIYNADCRKVLPWMDRFDLLLTDPPYGINYGKLMKGKGDGNGGLDGNRWKHYEDFDWDENRPEPYVIQMLLSVADVSIIWGGNYFADCLPPSMGWLVWNKCQRAFSLADFEMAWTSQRVAARAFDLSRPEALKDGRRHPTQKPVALMKWCLGRVPDAKTVVDPYMGSGTTILAAKLEGRQAVGIEINEKYCESAAKRLEQGVLF